MDNLIVICEGGIHTVEYLHRNGVFPSALLVEPTKFQDISPYLTKDDDILLIIKGLTDFTMANIYALLSKFRENEEKFKRVTILSNVPLGAISYDYYLYTGDIFYGDVKKITNKRTVELDMNGNEVSKDEKKSILKKKVDYTKTRNPIMMQFRKYNNKGTRLRIYGKATILEEVKPNTGDKFEYEDKIKIVDLFSKKKDMEESKT